MKIHRAALGQSRACDMCSTMTISPHLTCTQRSDYLQLASINFWGTCGYLGNLRWRGTLVTASYAGWPVRSGLSGQTSSIPKNGSVRTTPFTARHFGEGPSQSPMARREKCGCASSVFADVEMERRSERIGWGCSSLSAKLLVSFDWTHISYFNDDAVERSSVCRRVRVGQSGQRETTSASIARAYPWYRSERQLVDRCREATGSFSASWTSTP